MNQFPKFVLWQDEIREVLEVNNGKYILGPGEVITTQSAASPEDCLVVPTDDDILTKPAKDMTDDELKFAYEALAAQRVSASDKPGAVKKARVARTKLSQADLDFADSI